jgi:hypothetical protein
MGPPVTIRPTLTSHRINRRPPNRAACAASPEVLRRSIWLADAQGELRAQLGVDSKREAILKLHETDGRVQWDPTAGASKDVPAQK